MKHANVAFFVPHEGCPHSCSFCNQKIIVGERTQSRVPSEEASPEALDSVIRLALSNPSLDPAGSEIAFFGGSFTAIERGRMTALLEAAYPYIRDGYFHGIRLSTRPDAIDAEVLTILKGYGVTSIELGAQSMSDNVLTANERGHTAQQVRDASRLISSYGFELGLQMMTGLYADNDETAVYTAKELIALSPRTVRIYPTVVLRGTRLAALMESGEYVPQTLDEAVSLCAVLIPMFYDAGISVIRVGLHSGGGVEEGYVAGAYHPAFRELCEGEIFYRNALRKLSDAPSGARTLLVAPRNISKMTGQGRKNLKRLAQLGYNCQVKPSPEAEKFGDFYVEVS